MSEWQPIETAPKDARLLLWAEGWTTGYYDSHLGGWRFGDECFSSPETPTHWMIPEPPNA